MNPTLGRLHLGGVDLEVVRGGSGPPLLLLHGADPSPPMRRFSSAWPATPRSSPRRTPVSVARPARLTSTRSTTSCTCTSTCSSISDDRVMLVGLSFGGWLAAEIAATRSHRLGG